VHTGSAMSFNNQVAPLRKCAHGACPNKWLDCLACSTGLLSQPRAARVATRRSARAATKNKGGSSEGSEPQRRGFLLRGGRCTAFPPDQVLQRGVALQILGCRSGGGRCALDLAVAARVHAVLDQATPGGAALAAPAGAHTLCNPIADELVSTGRTLRPTTALMRRDVLALSRPVQQVRKGVRGVQHRVVDRCGPPCGRCAGWSRRAAGAGRGRLQHPAARCAIKRARPAAARPDATRPAGALPPRRDTPGAHPTCRWIHSSHGLERIQYTDPSQPVQHCRPPSTSRTPARASQVRAGARAVATAARSAVCACDAHRRARACPASRAAPGP